jgi:hypothetical protein
LGSSLEKTVFYISILVPISFPGYRCSIIKTPIAIAKMAMRIPSPEKMRPSNCISPPMMSQIPNKSMLRFLGSLGRFIERLLSVNELRVFVEKL